MNEKVKCDDCERFDTRQGWCMVTSRICKRDSLRNCKFFLRNGSTARHDEPVWTENDDGS